ncbi:MAG: hypothetical protein DRI57_03925 [Deltaproteobacteria bacterium]|nr:MAG: hypothetical protein DRI57_03925 [Deltaproteobacteria bacterium]
MKTILTYAVLSFFVSCLSAFAQRDDYYGSASIDSPAGLGNIDLAFHLETDDGGNIISTNSYIILEKTILFPKADNQVDGKDVGPKIQKGELFPFYLETKSFTTTVTEKEVTRKIILDGTNSTEIDSITGTYTETISGYLPAPVTVRGTFVLVRPAQEAFHCQYLDTLEPTDELTIEEIRAGGSDPRPLNSGT